MIPALLHLGDVTHVRHAPPMHRFRYRLWMISLDLDRIDEVARRSWLFRHNRTGLVALHDRDHGPRDGSPLRPWVEAELRAAGLGDAAAHIRVMLIPRLAKLKRPGPCRPTLSLRPKAPFRPRRK